jgi:hypothetical protein
VSAQPADSSDCRELYAARSLNPLNLQAGINQHGAHRTHCLVVAEAPGRPAGRNVTVRNATPRLNLSSPEDRTVLPYSTAVERIK